MRLEPPQARKLRGMMKSIEKQLSSALKMEAALEEVLPLLQVVALELGAEEQSLTVVARSFREAVEGAAAAAIVQKEEELQALEEEARSTRRQLQEQQERADMLHGRVERLDEEVQTKESELRSTLAELTQARDELAKAQKKLAELGEGAQRAAEELAALKKEHAEKKEYAGRGARTTHGPEGVNVRLTRVPGERACRQCTRLEASLEAKEKEATALGQQLARAQELSAQAEQMLNAAEQRERELQEKEAATAARLEEKAAELIGMTAQMEEQAARADGLQATLDEARAGAAEAEERHATQLAEAVAEAELQQVEGVVESLLDRVEVEAAAKEAEARHAAAGAAHEHRARAELGSALAEVTTLEEALEAAAAREAEIREEAAQQVAAAAEAARREAEEEAAAQLSQALKEQEEEWRGRARRWLQTPPAIPLEDRAPSARLVHSSNRAQAAPADLRAPPRATSTKAVPTSPRPWQVDALEADLEEMREHGEGARMRLQEAGAREAALLLELKAADHELHKCEGELSLEELEHQDTIAELQKAQDAMQARRPPMRPARRPLHR